MLKGNYAPDVRAMVNDMTLPDFVVEFARELGIDDYADNMEIFDRIDVLNRCVDADAIEELFKELDCGWDLTLGGITGDISQGDMVGSFSAGERTVHAFAHMGYTTPMEMDDPSLRPVLKTIASTRKEAVVLHLIPQVLFPDHNEGKPFLMGGWHLEGGAWTPFLVTPKGSDDLLTQKELMKNGEFEDLMIDDRSVGRDLTKLRDQFLAKFEMPGLGEARKVRDELKAAQSNQDAPSLVTAEEE